MSRRSSRSAMSSIKDRIYDVIASIAILIGLSLAFYFLAPELASQVWRDLTKIFTLDVIAFLAILAALSFFFKERRSR